MQFIVARLFQAHQLFVELDTGPRIDGGIGLLLILKDVTLPVRKEVCLADTLTEQVGLEFLKAQVLDADLSHAVLQVDEVTRRKLT